MTIKISPLSENNDIVCDSCNCFMGVYTAEKASLIVWEKPDSFWPHKLFVKLLKYICGK